MSGLKNTNWEQWDAQELRRLQNQAFIHLNNTYLAVERGELALTITVANNLRVLVGLAYDKNDQTMFDYWQGEFEKLPGWFDV